ncbi:type II secretion system protein [Prochlorococcus sp. MIT 1307]|uniref:pilus assembly FimT family protein n=1 Tax=Prochlorococcus sp. MIT 1307 TaxID=3096219 RepID=UPI002A7541A6|nr:type II secretion system protein [Prochlorococcus sp. MIT 1307]
MKNPANKFRQGQNGFSLIELVIIVGMISTLSGFIVPSSLNWIRVEKVNSYTRQLREYFRIVRLDARRWGSSCFININQIAYNSVPNDKDYYGYSVTCTSQSDPNNSSKIGALIPPINNSIFQVVNKAFQVTPNGRISSDKSIVIVIGSKHHRTSPKILNCLVIKSPTGQIVKGKFNSNYWIKSNMAVSQVLDSDVLTPNNCSSS